MRDILFPILVFGIGGSAAVFIGFLLIRDIIRQKRAHGHRNTAQTPSPNPASTTPASAASPAGAATTAIAAAPAAPPTPDEPMWVWDSIYGIDLHKEIVPGKVVDQLVLEYGNLGRLLEYNGEKHFGVNRVKENGEIKYRLIESYKAAPGTYSPEELAAAHDTDAWKDITTAKGTGNGFMKNLPFVLITAAGVAGLVLLGGNLTK